MTVGSLADMPAMNDPNRVEMDRKLWDLCMKALDQALDADASDGSAMSNGLQAAQLITYSRGDLHPPGLARDEPEIEQSTLRIDRIALEVGPELARLADPATAGDLLERLRHVRRRMAREFGVILPGVRVRPHLGLDPGVYHIRLNGNVVGSGEVLTTHVLGTGTDLDVPELNAVPATDPFGRPAVWIPEHESSAAERHGLDVFDAQDVVATHVAETIKLHMAELLTRDEVAELLNVARHDSPMVVQELLPNLLSLGQIRQVLQNLVREQVPINDIATILNALADRSIYTKSPDALTEHVREVLSRTICARHRSEDGSIHGFSLSREAEQLLLASIQLHESGQVMMLEREASLAVINDLSAALVEHADRITAPIVFTTPKLRRHVRALLSNSVHDVVVLSTSEIDRGTMVEVLGQLGIDSYGDRPTDVDPRSLPAAVSWTQPQPVGEWLQGG